MITVTVLVKNGERHLQAVLEALKNFNEIIIYDTGSTDHTLAIATQFKNVKFIAGEFNGFGATHNKAVTYASHDWILSIDADEIMEETLSAEIHALSLNPEVVYEIPRRNFLNGKEIKWGGWSHESVIRLYHRQKTCFSEDRVHEGVLTKGMKKIKLRHALLHTPYNSISDFLKKMEFYSTLFAQEHKSKKRSSPFIALTHSLGAFFRSYFVKGGLFSGYEGLLIASYNAHTAFYKYLKLYHINKS